ncbi:MAG: VPLPA-CTERM sorting domain-containing protein [Hydrogenophaga sp.]|uniref:PEP-CTERM sorting domain-containing protein n=1 Tax=Hydrogenophaga sp. TaxID=1904254 RepID=UPI001694B156|nr:PEP-CTERM sorting domain-containing protein [Hydrogenophaga sp.]NIM41023.1 VPLPA-CTERM sorting domain-containing protein [Hydrogenophaga sp.]NIN26381.1 VPLPA-CTERM sorting domain-containing protein [Hydrogenophaga sp.]NIN31256.1 VPLPA-CTERM sorting domain-containing protein [Hydrogenophaga sp.]NIN55295.1 VPLPA-CTERM sorting domain-containing protein [Hydrogenophaga sp.]NIO53679.1 VPLPA-CTERM sorting domain-containing protein [Hydrogenophaga sp.]
MKKLLVSLVAALGLMAGAQAATFQSVVNGDGLVTDYSTDGLISFDLDFQSLGTTTLSYVIGAADTAALSFNALLRNLTGDGITGFNFSISGGEFLYSGTVTRQFDGSLITDIDFNGAHASVDLGSPEFLDVEIGDPLAVAGGQLNWGLTGLSAGDVLNISVTAVPEPESIAMLLAGLGVLGAVARRRQRLAA